MAIDKYLNQLISDKQALVDNLVEKGIEASSDETFTTLVPKVSEIETGGGKYAPEYVSFANYNGTEITLDGLDTSKITNMSRTFNECSKLTSLNLNGLNTSNVTNMQYTFYKCSALRMLDISVLDTSKVSNMYSTFFNCSGLVTLILGDMLSVNSITSNTFSYLSNLENLTFGPNLGKGFTQKSNNYSMHKLDLSSCTKLTHESLMSVINNLYDLNLTYDVANGGTLYTQQLVLGSTNLAKLTPEEIAIATNKGWTVS